MLEQGDLLPDSLVIELVLRLLDKLDRSAPETGFVLDGFPRSVSQAIALDAWAESRGRRLDVVVRLLVPRAELERRLRRRAAALGRTDDVGQSVEHRIELYELTAPALVEYYSGRGLLVDVNGEGDEDEVAMRIERAVQRIRSGQTRSGVSGVAPGRGSPVPTGSPNASTRFPRPSAF